MLLVMRLVEIASLLNSPHPPLRPRGGAEGGGVIQPMESNSRFTLIAAATTGLLFGLHPLHVESVAWVAERKDLLCALFYLLSIMAYTSYLKRGWGDAYRQAGSRGRYLLALCFFILALMSKPMAVSLPVVLLILDWYPFGRIHSLKTVVSSLAEKLPFIGLSVASSVVTVFAQRDVIQSTEFIPLSVRLPVAAKSLVVYLWKMLIPVNLAPFYPYPESASLFSPEYLFAVVLVAACTTAFVIIAKKKRLPLAVWGYYLATLMPVIGLVQVVLSRWRTGMHICRVSVRFWFSDWERLFCRGCSEKMAGRRASLYPGCIFCPGYYNVVPYHRADGRMERQHNLMDHGA